MERNNKCEEKIRTAAVGCDSTLNFMNGGSSCISTVEKVIQPIKRRSFSKRTSLFSEAKNEEHDADQSERTTAAGSSLEAYMGRLRLEIEAWRAMRKERKQRYKLSKRGPLKLDWESCADLLTEKDKQFHDDRPDYDRIVTKMRQVEEMASIVAHLEQTNVHKGTRIEEIAQLQCDAIKRCICKRAEGTLHSDEYYPPVS